MKLLPIACYLVLCCLSFSSFSQTVYHFKYNFQQPADTTNYEAFFIQHENGTATSRILYTNPVSKEIVLVETDMQEQYILDRSGMTDTSRVLYRQTKHHILSKDEQVPFNTGMAFIFKTDPLTGYSDPAGVIYNDGNDWQMTPGTIFTATYFERHDLKPAFVLKFTADPTEDFYTSLFPIGIKGATAVNKDTKMYLLVVANILDADIGASCTKDMARMVESFNDIAHKLGIPEKNIIIKTISGNEYNRTNVQQAIANLKPAPKKDIVVFYYTGHGFRKTTRQKISQFPYIDLRSKTDSNYMTQSLNMEKDIFDVIVRKGARFNLILGDCCNTYAPVPRVESTKPTKVKGSGFLLSQDNCNTLFMNKMPISILACAADSNQRATGNKDIGGFFSYFLKNSMENYCSIFEKEVSWKKILDDTYKQTIYKAEHTYCDRPFIPANICYQKPIVKTIPKKLE